MEVPVSRILSLLFLFLASCSSSSCYRQAPFKPTVVERPWEAALLATATVEATDLSGTAIGTAWLAASDSSSSAWVTAGHVCSPGAMYTVVHDEREYAAAVLAYSDEPDLCTLVTFGSVNAAPVRLATEAPEVGDELCYTGNPLGIMSAGVRPIFCGKMAGYGLGKQFLAAPGMSGASGSAVVNAQGEVVGVLVAVIRGWPEVLFLVTLDDLAAFLHKH